MAPFADHLLFNAAAAAVLAQLAFASKWMRRPALTHFLWLIVLVRLVVPPMYTLRLPSWEAEPTVQPVAQITESIPFSEIDFTVIEATTTPDDLFAQEPADQPLLAPIESSMVAFPWSQMILGAWAVISIMLLVGMIGRAVGFRRSVGLGVAPDKRLSDLVAALSRRLGLRRSPRVILLSDRISPCVWAGLWRPTLALPAGWLDGLSRLQQTAVLVHELAHLRRRDHWVRWMETIVVTLYWWHPVVWVARRELREAEELCCDGWVVATLPAARRAYADALVDTLDFLATARPALPPLASGFGQVHELKRRIHMILKANPAYRPGRAGAILALCFALLLPFGVARSDEPQDTPPPPPPPPERPNDQPPPRATRPGDDRPRGDIEDRERARANEERAHAKVVRDRSDTDEVDRLRDEMRKAEEQMAQAQQRLERLRRRMEELGANMPRQPASATLQPRGSFGGGDRPRANQAELEKAMLRLRLQELELREKLGEDHPDIQKIRKQIDEIKRSTADRAMFGGDPARGEGRGEGSRPAQPAFPVPPTPPAAPAPVRGAPPSPFAATPPLENRRGPGNAGPAGGVSGGDPRIDELAKAVSELRRAVEEMRRDRERDRRPPQPNP
jgi:beta-lactamase regulating signal transducer with metallopeptidase domain/outer membrane murein-binding lipoprotein Lpp